MERRALWLTGMLGVVAFLAVGTTRADSPTAPTTPKSEADFPLPYDGFQASRDVQLRWDARRIDAINRQLGWNELLRWRAATAESGTLYYSPHVPYRWEPAWGNWPYAVGRIDGYGFYDAVRQPIGRQEMQTGPNRWESFPIYAEDIEPLVVPLAPPRMERPAPPPAPVPQAREF